MTTHGRVENGGESTWNLQQKKATYTGTAAFQQCMGHSRIALLCCTMLVCFDTAWGSVHGSFQPAIARDLAKGWSHGVDCLSVENLARIATCRTHIHTRLFLACCYLVEVSVFHKLLLTQRSSYPLPILDLNHFPGVIVLFFDHSLSPLDSSLSALSRSKSSAQDSVCFQACGVNVFKSR